MRARSLRELEMSARYIYKWHACPGSYNKEMRKGDEKEGKEHDEGDGMRWRKEEGGRTKEDGETEKEGRRRRGQKEERKEE